MDRLVKTQLLQKITENVPGVIYQFQLFPDGRVCFPFSSEALIDITGVSPKDVVEDATLVFDMIFPDDLHELRASIMDSAETLNDWDYEFRVCHPTRGVRWIHGFSRPEKRSDGSVLWHGFLNDITERKNLEEKLLKASRLNLLNGKINSMIIHAKDHLQLFAEACQILVQEGEFKMAWIGLIDPAKKNLVVANSFGDEHGYLNKINPISLSDKQGPLGPSARSILEKMTVVNNDSENNASYIIWKDMALRIGYRSSISLPIFVNGIVIGNINIYSDKVNYFTRPEMKLLEELTQNVSYAISVIEKESALAMSEFSFRTIFDEAPMGIALIDSENGSFYKINTKYLEILGRSLDEIKDLTWMALTHPEDLNNDIEQLNLLKAGKICGYKLVKRFLHSDGSIIWAEISVVPFYSKETMLHLCMVENISDRVRYEEELRTALKVRDEFLSIASHELKTPITSLKLQVQLITRDLKRSEALDLSQKYIKALDMASRQTDRLTFLVDNLLDVTRVESGQFNIRPVRFNLSQVLLDTIDRFHGLLLEANCPLTLNVSPDIVGVWDQNRIEQVLVNLISNAVKYAPEKPIVIELRADSDHAVFRIKDHGPGLTEADKSKIFQQFKRVKSSLNISGLGLGLYISKKIIDSHKGLILVDSEEGQGTIFTVKLPLA